MDSWEIEYHSNLWYAPHSDGLLPLFQMVTAPHSNGYCVSKNKIKFASLPLLVGELVPFWKSSDDSKTIKQTNKDQLI